MESRKRQGTECDCYDVVQKKPARTPALNKADDRDEQDLMAWVTLDDETVMELSELLDSSSPEINSRVKFIEDPYMTPVIFQSSSAYVTINGNEESCGSSFSDSESSVMASVDMGSFRGALRRLSRELEVNDDDGAWSSSAAAAEEEARGWMDESDYVEGIFVKSLSGVCDLFSIPHPPPPQLLCGDNHENDSGFDEEGEMWVNFFGEDLFGGAW